MEKDFSVIDYEVQDNVAVIVVNNPPVNALSFSVRAGLLHFLMKAANSKEVCGIIIACEGRTFIAGADISEFGSKPKEPDLPELLDYLDRTKKPVLAEMHGTALGGGLELALCCNYRIAAKNARFGLPEVNLGLIPGAGGTQRLPRLIGIEKSLAMVTSGSPIGSTDAYKCGLVDQLSEENLRYDSLNFIKDIIETEAVHPSISLKTKPIVNDEETQTILKTYRSQIRKRKRGFIAPEYNIRSIQASLELEFRDGLKFERKLFDELMEGEQSRAQQYLFFAERQANKIPDLDPKIKPVDIQKVVVIGGGLMGSGIAMCMANAGISVTIIESSKKLLDRCWNNITANYQSTQKKGRLSQEQVKSRLRLIDVSLEFEKVSDADLVIEAVFENMELKKDIFRKVGKLAKKNAILASNTSALDLNTLSESSGRPQDVIGLHFFSPANVMRLLEVVRAQKTSVSVIYTCMKLAKIIKKIPVLVGVCPGFVGNRILFARQEQAMRLAMQGIDIERIDRLIYEFGFPMGPFQTADLIGLDLGWEKAFTIESLLVDKFCEVGRFGQKNLSGFYDYDASRKATKSKLSEKLIKDFAKSKGIPKRDYTDDEILDQCLLPMINEGVKIREENVVTRNSDIDVVYAHGFGWPAYRGGPMYFGRTLGSDKVLKKINYYSQFFKDRFWQTSHEFRNILDEK